MLPPPSISLGVLILFSLLFFPSFLTAPSVVSEKRKPRRGGFSPSAANYESHEPQFPHPQNGDAKNTCSRVCWAPWMLGLWGAPGQCDFTLKNKPVRWVALGPTFQMGMLGPRELRVFAPAHRAGQQESSGLNPHQLCCKAQTIRLHCLLPPTPRVNQKRGDPCQASLSQHHFTLGLAMGKEQRPLH